MGTGTAIPWALGWHFQASPYQAECTPGPCTGKMTILGLHHIEGQEAELWIQMACLYKYTPPQPLGSRFPHMKEVKIVTGSHEEVMGIS